MRRAQFRSICRATLLAILIPAAVRAADEWSLTTSDFSNQAVSLRGMDQIGVSVLVPPSTQPSTIAANDFLSLDRPSDSTQRSRFTLFRRNGDVLTGDIESIDGDTLRWREAIFGPISIPIGDVDAISRTRPDDLRSNRSREPATDDVAMLLNGDAVHGVIAGLTGNAVSMQRPDGTTVPIPVDSLKVLRFAATGQPTSTTAGRSAKFFRIKLFDGSTVSANEMSVKPPTVDLLMDDGTHRQFALDSVESIEQIGGPVAWVSESASTENVQTPMFDRAQPARFNRSVTGERIRFGDRTFAHGIGVHAYSRLSWPVGPRDQTFRTQFAIDGDAPYADLNVRIKLDGQVVSETRDVRSGVLSPVIWLDVNGAHTLTLEVEAANDQVQARLNWIEPALLRFKPTEAQRNGPATRP